MDVPYTSIVQSHLPRHPCLAKLYDFLIKDEVAMTKSRVASLKIGFESRQAILTGFGRQAVSQLADGFLRSDEDQQLFQNHGHLLLIENIDRQTVSELGIKLKINPIFFASHVHALGRDMEASSPDLCELPSMRKCRTFANFQYHRTSLFPDLNADDYLLLRPLNIRRKVVVLPPINGKRVGLAQHCCSTLVVPRSDRCWLGETLNGQP